MARFDVYRRRGRRDYLLDCQSDYLSELATRFVVPLLPAATAPRHAERLNPRLDVGGESFVMMTHLAAAVPRAELSPKVGNVADEQGPIMDALDFLMTGF